MSWTFPGWECPVCDETGTGEQSWVDHTTVCDVADDEAIER